MPSPGPPTSDASPPPNPPHKPGQPPSPGPDPDPSTRFLHSWATWQRESRDSLRRLMVQGRSLN